MEVSSVRKPPLAMTDHFFAEINIVANHALSPQEVHDGKKFGYEFTLDVDVAASPSVDREFQVQLTIQSNEKPDYLKGYDIKLVVVGFFLVAEGIEGERRQEIARVIGPTLLYGAARDFLYSLTMRGPHPGVYLPTTSFIPETNVPPQASTESCTPPSAVIQKKKQPKNKT